MSTRTTATAPRPSPLRQSPTGQGGTDAPANNALEEREWVQALEEATESALLAPSVQQASPGPSG
jgi:hypothetical protein